MKTRNRTANQAGGGLWLFFVLMYLFTSRDVFPVDKLEFFWRFVAGPFNFLPI